MGKFPNGLDVLSRELRIDEIMKLIERCARWVDRETNEYLPVWFPEYARNSLLYNANWTEPRMIKNRQTGDEEHKREGNMYANQALTHALGTTQKDRPYWSCCHIWSVDDDSYQLSNVVVQDRRYFSCVSNMVLLPSPLKAFTDVMDEVKMMLRVCAVHNYGWSCDHEDVTEVAEKVENWTNWASYPDSWPKPGRNSTPHGTIPFSGQIKKYADRRKDKIRQDLTSAGQYYPRDDVEKVLDFWSISL